jgi:hypothetical protein
MDNIYTDFLANLTNNNGMYFIGPFEEETPVFHFGDSERHGRSCRTHLAPPCASATWSWVRRKTAR